MVGFEPTTPKKPMVLPTTPFIKELVLTVLTSPFDHLQKANQ